MKQPPKKWLLRLTLSGLFLLALLVSFILYPSLLYAHKTTAGNCCVYHNSDLDRNVIIRLAEAAVIIKSTELYDDNLKYDICLNDGSWYPSLMKMIFNEPIGTTFYNKIVFWGTINFKDNYGLVSDHKWNMTQLIAHLETHCLQFNKLGFWKSNPIAGYPDWKWEGYAEYVARKYVNNNHLAENIDRLVQAEKSGHTDWISFSDGTGASVTFYKRWLLVQFCSDIKKMDFEQLLKDTTSEEVVRKEMMIWYKSEPQSKQ